MGLFGSGGVSFKTAADIPSLAGKTILVTGGNSGLGKQSVLDFARYGQPSLIWLAGRNADRCQLAIDEIVPQLPSGSSTVIKPLVLDLTSFGSIRTAAQRVVTESSQLNILMLNAGIMTTPPGLTADGYEIQFGTNHVGHALLTKLLMPLLLQTAAQSKPDDLPRVVVLASMGHKTAPGGEIIFDKLKSEQLEINTLSRYGQSKLANVLFARELAKRYKGQLITASVDPGLVNTNLANPIMESMLIARLVTPVVSKIFGQSPAEGAKGQLWAAMAKEVESGEYYGPAPGKKGYTKQPEKWDALGEKLWGWTEKELEGVTL
ncbi:hypothetical protein B0H63DRAFT_190940 [Podospora didyma]|uniref:Oxidoreductase n=1 Tax=Podospora didyma TaxID=330526 RepID=A0AAE0NQV4_9PEZI|nr:hypothetical protein B0H63DRAFT_190940 [Podospora didyma]